MSEHDPVPVPPPLPPEAAMDEGPGAEVAPMPMAAVGLTTGAAPIVAGGHPTAAAVAMLAHGGSFSWGLFTTSIAVAFVIHATIGFGTHKLPQPKALNERVEMAIFEEPPPPPPPEEPPPPEPEPEKKKPKPKKKKPKKIAKAPPPPEPPPSNSEPPPDEPPPAEPPPVVTGISMSSTTTGKSGFKVRVGNTAYGDPNKEKFVDPSKIKAYRGGKAGKKAKFAKVRTADLSSQAEMVKKYKERYPKQLIDEGIEGKVVMLVKIDRQGRVRGVKILKRLHPKLDKLSVLSVRKSKFRPARGKSGKPVDSIIRHTVTWDITG